MDERPQTSDFDPERSTLAAMVGAGMSIRAIAAELGASYSAVRHRLRRHGLVTHRAATLAETRPARERSAETTIATCKVHGRTTYVRRGASSFRCAACRSEAVSDRRRRVKALLVEEAGGACVLCGYDRSPAGLQFHHVDPEQKRFSVSRNGSTMSLAAARAEASKCVLLCATCHAEVESGVATLRPAIPDPSGGRGPG